MKAINKIVKHLNEIQEDKVYENTSNILTFELTGFGKNKIVIRYDDYDKFIDKCLEHILFTNPNDTFDPFE